MKKVTKGTVASKYRQGKGWIVSSYSPTHDGWITSTEMSYAEACATVRDARADWDTRAQDYKPGCGWMTRKI